MKNSEVTAGELEEGLGRINGDGWKLDLEW